MLFPRSLEKAKIYFVKMKALSLGISVVWCGCVGAIVAAVLIFIVRGFPVKTVRTPEATAQVFFSAKNILHVHSDFKKVLIVKGQRYEGLRGEPPFYLRIPKSQKILFVTEAPNAQAAFHILDLDSGEDQRIAADACSFGSNVGSDRKAGEALTDYIESFEGEKLVIAVRAISWKELCTLDLRKGVIQGQEVVHYSAEGTVKK